MKRLLSFGLFMLMVGLLTAQSNITVTNTAADAVLRGNYTPANYAPTVSINHPDSIVQHLLADISPDSMLAWMTQLQAFHTRHTSSDTVSPDTGIGATRRWIANKFTQFSAENEQRLLTGYLQFDQTVCGVDQHKNVLGVLPGLDPNASGIVIVEAHMDSRCDGACDVTCQAYGADDNGSGTVLVMELARVMSRFALDRTVVFMLTTGEEQGLYGADAMADYCFFEGIPVHAVFNNDVVGGIYCGQTASFPGCPGAGDVDSLNLRMYSFGSFNSPHKQLARWIKLEYQENLKPLSPVPMTLQVMTQEDRSGRGGDHIPFRQKAFSAMRFTCANEHGNGNPQPGYTDRQHTSGDSLGVDTNNDGVVDSFYVDFNYLARNARINGNAIAMAALGPEAPTFTLNPVSGGVQVDVVHTTPSPQMRVAWRTATQDWDSVAIFNGNSGTITGLDPNQTYLFSAASVDSLGIESLFSNEAPSTATFRSAPQLSKGLELLNNRPNPFDEATAIGVRVSQSLTYSEAWIEVRDLEGREIERLPIDLQPGVPEVIFRHGFHASGVFTYSLVVDGQMIDTKRMIFAN